MNHLKLFNSNLFTATDHAILRAAVKSLPGLLAMIVEQRFWKRMSLMEIAIDLGVSITTIEHSLEKAGKMIREQCLRNPAFSRSRYKKIALLRAQSAA